jgi:tetratricopeptide (TPR) repeat protein
MVVQGRLSSFQPVCWLVILLLQGVAQAQPPMPVPRTSPKGALSQTIGITEVTVAFHRPGAKNRIIWGQLVPYNEVWRVGANENTTIAFSDPVRIEGKELPAGKYGLHMIPTPTTWTIILSKNSTSWGSSFYTEAEDALRVTVQPQPAEHREWLGFEFEELTAGSAVLALRWEKIRVPLRINVDTKNIVVANARNSYLRGQAGFRWEGYSQAATYCLQNNVNLDEALTWADKSISMNENVTNLSTKAGLLEKLGRNDDAQAVRDRSIKIAVTEADFDAVGHQLLGANRIREALDVFKKNAKQHPESWKVYDGLGEAYEKNGDTKLAVENYTKALGMVKDAENKKRIGDALKKLAGK